MTRSVIRGMEAGVAAELVDQKYAKNLADCWPGDIDGG
jgi:hypothetical protein